MKKASEFTTTSHRIWRSAGWLLVGLVTVTVAACSNTLPTTPTAPAAADGVVLHQYARGYAPADHGSNNWYGQGSGAAASCIDTGTVSQVIGDDGGTLSLGGTTFSVPQHSLSNYVRITMVLLPGTASVQFYPEGLVFKSYRQPTLTINTDCIGDPSSARIVYTDNTGLILQLISSFRTDYHSVSALIPHFSRYAVDW